MNKNEKVKLQSRELKKRNDVYDVYHVYLVYHVYHGTRMALSMFESGSYGALMQLATLQCFRFKMGGFKRSAAKTAVKSAPKRQRFKSKPLVSGGEELEEAVAEAAETETGGEGPEAVAKAAETETGGEGLEEGAAEAPETETGGKGPEGAAEALETETGGEGEGPEEGAAEVVAQPRVWSFAEIPEELKAKGKKRAGLKKVWEALKEANQQGLVADKALDLVGPALVEAASKQGYTVPFDPVNNSRYSFRPINSGNKNPPRNLPASEAAQEEGVERLKAKRKQKICPRSKEEYKDWQAKQEAAPLGNGEGSPGF